jgi:hypothetical protein
MTASMRAASPLREILPKRLRVGLVVSGRLVQERLVKRGTRVTVGPDERSMFVVRANVPPRFALFEPVGRGFCVNLLEGMTVRLALADGIHDLAVLKQRATRIGAGYRVRLTDEARGKIVLGDTTLLFQLVDSPPPAPRPQLPLAVKGFVGPIDWTMTVLVATSFLVHFGLVGAMYSDWMDPVLDADLTGALVDIARRTVPAPIETMEPVATAAPTPTVSEETPPAPSATATPTLTPDQPHPPDPSTSDATTSLVKELERLHIDVVTGIGAGPHLHDAMTGQEPPLDMSHLGEGSAGVAPGSGLNLPTAGAPIRPGEAPGGLPSLSPHQTSTVSSTAGTAVPVVPTGEVHYTPPLISAPIADAEAVIRTKLHPRAKRCYQQGLDLNPTQEGRLVIVMQVAPNGEVDLVRVESNAGLSAKVAGCIAGAARSVTFAAPGGGGSLVRVPFVFRRGE